MDPDGFCRAVSMFFFFFFFFFFFCLATGQSRVIVNRPSRLPAIVKGSGLPDNKVHGANMGPIWGRQDPDGPHVGPMNPAIWGPATRELRWCHLCRCFLFFLCASILLNVPWHYCLGHCIGLCFIITDNEPLGTELLLCYCLREYLS